MLYIDYPSWIKPEIIPGLPIRWYGLMYAVAFAIAYLLFRWQLKDRKLKVPSDLVANLFFWTIIGLLLGARLFATTIYDTTGIYRQKPWLIFWPFSESGKFTGLEGMSFHGGVVGAIAAFIIFCRVKKVDTLDWGDMLVQGIPLGYTFGRLGNFINGELYGKVSESPWAVLFPNATPLPINEPWTSELAKKFGIAPDGNGMVNLPRHPSQLYEAFFEGIVLWLILWLIVRKRSPFRGFAIGVYLIGYAVFRFFIEYFRQPDAGLDYIIKLGPGQNNTAQQESLLNFSTGQLLNVFMILVGVVFLVVAKRADKRRPRAEMFDTSAEEAVEQDDARKKRNERKNLRKKLK